MIRGNPIRRVRHFMEVVARRTVLETDAVCAVSDWWDLLRVDKDVEPKWRESGFPAIIVPEDRFTRR